MSAQSCATQLVVSSSQPATSVPPTEAANWTHKTQPNWSRQIAYLTTGPVRPLHSRFLWFTQFFTQNKTYNWQLFLFELLLFLSRSVHLHCQWTTQVEWLVCISPVIWSAAALIQIQTTVKDRCVLAVTWSDSLVFWTINWCLWDCFSDSGDGYKWSD